MGSIPSAGPFTYTEIRFYAAPACIRFFGFVLENREGIGILSESAENLIIADLCVDQRTRVAFVLAA